MTDLINTHNIANKFVEQYYDKFISTNNFQGYYPQEYNEFLSKYDKDVLNTHCSNIIDHHLDISKYLLDICYSSDLLARRVDAAKKVEKSFMLRTFGKIKKALVSILCSTLFVDCLCTGVLLYYAISSFVISHAVNVFTFIVLATAIYDIYKVGNFLYSVFVKKTKKMSDCLFYKPKNKINELEQLVDVIYSKFFDYLKGNNTIPERKLMEVMRKNPCMYNDEAFLGLYLIAKQNISVFDSAENVDDAKVLAEHTDIEFNI